MNKVTVIIVNYKVATLTIKCLESLVPQLRATPKTKAIVVDNDSRDGSFETLKECINQNEWRDCVDLIASEKNGGFAYGNNIAIEKAIQDKSESEYYWLLNPDTVVMPRAMESLLVFMDDNQKVGICGGSIENEDGELWPICFRFPGILSEFERGIRLGPITRLLDKWRVPRVMENKNTIVDWLPGASFMIRSEVFIDIGLMDDDYFLYYEETDFCLNAKRQGWQCWYVPASRVMHIAGASTGVVNQQTEKKPLPRYMFDSRYRYFRKNHGLLYAAFADLSWILAYSIYSLRKSISRKPRDDPKNLLWDSIKNSTFIRIFK